MPSLSLDQAIALAIEHHQASRLAEAEAIYRQVLAVSPQHPDALHLLGVIAQQVGRHGAAAELIGKAITQRPNFPAAHNNLGNTFTAQRDLDQAIAAYRRAIELKPDYAEAYLNLGNALKDQGQLDAAIAVYRSAIQIRSDYVDAHNNLGVALRDQGQLEAAIAMYRAAIQLQPDCAQAHSNLGVALADQGRADQAVAAYRAALELSPGDAVTQSNLGNALRDQGDLDLALAAYHAALKLRPDDAVTYSNMSNALKEQGRLDEAIAACRTAIELQPDYAAAHSNLILTMVYQDGDGQRTAEEARSWNARHAEPLRHLIQPHKNDRTPDRRIKIGYVSPDFREHPVGRFMVPLLAAHDHRLCEVCVYADVVIPDLLTQQMQLHADRWVNIVGLSDERVAELVRRDGIDVLVDLCGHMAHNRLLVFARKPAPVQVTYLWCAAGTGLAAMDYRLSDPYLDPPSRDDASNSERVVRLPETYWCYAPTCPEIPVALSPALAEGSRGVTFGSMNNFCKITPRTLATWGRLLMEVPTARLIMHAYEGSHRGQTLETLAKAGVDAARVKFVGRAPIDAYYHLYDQIDIALDPFPYAGGTTTCDALWMGVPVVSLCGATAVARGGISLLSNIGLPDLVAHSEEEYVRIAMDLANDVARLAELRTTLRQRMEASPLMVGPRFARNVEAAYRAMWRTWCKRT